ncbi:sodium- and chloride-dependent glycine transporter 2-like [Haliotis rufescens]|uniref:sodium- and chloride-dependent glycine transporter 2-like n=1 Tax=Haliotis rufescens TaxID=6454 RepID=UPI00201F26E9|nr:sodium- and chloride-dependent glycine transporter 2-like [Haliotis rufescens]
MYLGICRFLFSNCVIASSIAGFNLAFIVYPEILASLPLPQLWSVLTFITLMTLAIDSMVPGIEIIVAAVEDQMPNLTKRQSWAVKSVVILSISLFGLIYISQGGIYVLTLVDWFVIFPSIAVFAILECLVVGWLYGTQRLQDDIDAMWGKRMPRPMTLCLKYVCPLLLLVVFSYSLYAYRPPKYGDYHFPDWATVIGWMISMVSIIPIPVIFTWKVYRASGDSLAKKLKRALKPRESWARSSQEETPYNGVLEPMI